MDAWRNNVPACTLSFLVIFASCVFLVSNAAAQTEIHSGETLIAHIDIPGAMRTFQFYGNVDTGVVILAVENPSYYWLEPEIRLYSPSGSLITSSWSSSQAIIDNRSLQVSGWYYVVVLDNGGDETGYINLSLALPGVFPVLPMTEITSGQTITRYLNPDMEFVAFYGEIGAGIVITAAENTDSYWLEPEIRLYSPSGAREASASSSTQAIIENHNLAETGWYVIGVIDNGGDDAGNFQLSLITMPGATSMGEIFSGETLSGSLDPNMECATFYGEIGAGVVITAAENTGSYWLEPEIRLYSPSGVREASASSSTQAIIENHNLAETGWYVIGVIDNGGDDAGNFYVSLAMTGLEPGPPMNEMVSGQMKSAYLDPDMEAFAFYGEAGAGVVITAAENTSSYWLEPEVRLYSPSGVREALASSSTQAVIEDHNLAETGWYVIGVIDNGGNDAGNFQLSLVTMPGPASNGDITSGESITAYINPDMESCEFYGEAGNGVVIIVTEDPSSYVLEPKVTLYSPSGVPEASSSSSTQAIINNHYLAETGWYVIAAMDDIGDDAGTIDISFAKFPPIPPIENPVPVFGSTVSGQNVVLSWEDNIGATVYDVYFGDGFPLPMIAEDIIHNSYALSELATETSYYWHVVMKDGKGYEIPGPYWRFETELTISAEITCSPPSGTVPFVTQITLILANNYLGQQRRMAGRIDVTIASGSFFSNWRSGYTNIAPGSSYVTTWNQVIPAGSLVIGNNVFALYAEDVTPSPFNQPPYPPAGYNDTSGCAVQAFAP